MALLFLKKKNFLKSAEMAFPEPRASGMGGGAGPPADGIRKAADASPTWPFRRRCPRSARAPVSLFQFGAAVCRYTSWRICAVSGKWAWRMP
ncbi:hypothetical protein B4135_2009 [Caldibacillus debilis]|uniref:Uncharacterized protein n=1 Tax=Caldibacillus debilis TaxID=301148 RepID=A0A150M6M3_9BACI|nr:hypothetical protein B4135_2009 [Caldibacillus debilis]